MAPVSSYACGAYGINADGASYCDVGSSANATAEAVGLTQSIVRPALCHQLGLYWCCFGRSHPLAYPNRLSRSDRREPYSVIAHNEQPNEKMSDAVHTSDCSICSGA
jgi:hypothetical protein